MLKSVLCFVLFISLSLGGACSPNNIVDIATSTSTLSTLVSALTTANLVSTISDSAAITVFAPTNLAFNNSGLPLSTLTVAQLTDILTYHVLGQSVNSSQLAASQTVAMLNGANATITKSGSAVKVNNYASVTTADVTACNGVVHIVDHVLIPPCLPTAGRNGILPDTIATAQSVSTLSTLVSQITAAGLTSALQGPGPFTVFAPTNAAFTAAGLTGLTTAQLQSTLLYHVVNGRILSSDLQATQTVATLNGQTITITVQGSTVSVVGARSRGTVTTANVQACNAVIHIIDVVLLPTQSLASIVAPSVMFLLAALLFL